MSENIPADSKALFDRKFVFAAILVGVAYTAIILILNKVINPAAAGVAGVALTALATGIFNEFRRSKLRGIRRG